MRRRTYHPGGQDDIILFSLTGMLRLCRNLNSHHGYTLDKGMINKLIDTVEMMSEFTDVSLTLGVVTPDTGTRSPFAPSAAHSTAASASTPASPMPFGGLSVQYLFGWRPSAEV